MPFHSIVIFSLFLLLCTTPPLLAENQPPVGKPAGAVMVPETFLRPWDPVTIFFSKDTGPGPMTAEDQPQGFVTFKPSHSGAYTWLDRRTLQFRPAEPWPPLTQFRWQVQGKTIRLETLMSAPTRTVPANGERDLQQVETVSLFFTDPLPVEDLAQVVTLTLRPLPGTGQKVTKVLDDTDFIIKTLERRSRHDEAGYVLMLHEPITLGVQAEITFQLSQTQDENTTFKTVTFSTAEPFRVTRLGCENQQLPISLAGSKYMAEQAISCRNRKLEIVFSTPLPEVSILEARNLVRLTPPIEDMAAKAHGEILSISGAFQSGVLYQVRLAPTPLRDRQGRDLRMPVESSGFVHFRAKPDFLNLARGNGIAERFGPQMIPLQGRGLGRLDLRIHKIDPLDRSFWPFPSHPLEVSDQDRPPGPGEEPKPFSDADRNIRPWQMEEQIKTLGSPAISTIVDLPLRQRGAQADFGLDLSPHLTRVSGAQQPGAYLIGLRRLDSSEIRSWMRLQVTDLSLTAVEENETVLFAVTSLASGLPVRQAKITLQGSHSLRDSKQWVDLAKGATDGQGIWRWQTPGKPVYPNRFQVLRIIVSKDDDTLVLDTTSRRQEYHDNHWQPNYGAWLQWSQQKLDQRGEQDALLCHIFTERPVYKPEAPVHIKGFLRHHQEGEFSIPTKKGILVVTGPGDLEWRYPLSLSEHGSFYHLFHEEKLPDGDYRATVKIGPASYGLTTFKKEAYRLPRFEVSLHGPDMVGLDQEFSVKLLADYYAGGSVAERPVRWRVTQFPYNWSPEKLEGFFYSTDARFSDSGRFEASPALVQQGVTDLHGQTKITLNPGLEPTAQPRRYVLEATVTGADDQTVSNTHEVKALPPFVLGLKVPRYMERADNLAPEIIAAGPDNTFLAGQEISLRVLQRKWHSYLLAGDFSGSAAKYKTEVVDQEIFQTTVISEEQPISRQISIPGAGVYIVELTGYDKLGRAQTVRVDLFAGGSEPLTWSRPLAKVFTVSSDQDEYAPGEKARLILESPFQKGRVLAVIEEPGQANRYEWLKVENGTALFELAVAKRFMPKIPVHFVLMRGRGEWAGPEGTDKQDLTKPATIAATKWIKVRPVKHRLQVDLTAPDKAMPGETVDITVQLTDDEDKPLSGEVALWLVDQAVLALGREQRLDPLPDFIIKRRSHLSISDTRNQTLGFLPFQEQPGGGVESKEEMDLMDKVTIRKNFQPVPFYNPSVMVDSTGKATVSVLLPDNLTKFKLRAKAVSGSDRFGFASGQIAVRLPVLVQPSLPRFVRPGDSFEALALGRIVEGEGGPGKAAITVRGLELKTPFEQPFQWLKGKPQRIVFPLTVSQPDASQEEGEEDPKVEISMAVQRQSDMAMDGFKVLLPVRPDRLPVREKFLTTLSADAPLILPGVDQPLRLQSLERSLLVAADRQLTFMAAGLDALIRYPYGCTEQRLSTGRALLASRRFKDLFQRQGRVELLESRLNHVVEWISTAVDEKGLVGFWPGSKGSVFLTAWSVLFLSEVDQAGLPIDRDLYDRLQDKLSQALRSDFADAIDGPAFTERVWALTALASADRLESGYSAELARQADYLDLESLAMVARSLARAEPGSGETLTQLKEKIWQKIVVRHYDGKEIYGGLADRAITHNRQILPTETRALAEAVHALAVIAPQDRSQHALLVKGLLGLANKHGWGTTNANSSALLALTATTEAGLGSMAEVQPFSLSIQGTEWEKKLDLNAGTPLVVSTVPTDESLTVVLETQDLRNPPTVLAETSYLPVQPGSEVEAFSRGLVVRRALFLIHEGERPPSRMELESPGQTLELTAGNLIEERIELVVPEDHHFLALTIPLAAGMEPLNPRLATAPPEAKPTGQLTLEPTYISFADHKMAYYYDSLSKGTYHFSFRTRAQTPGTYIQPPAMAELMYDRTVNGNSHGAWIQISAKAHEE